MIRSAVDRARDTRRSMVVSSGLHALLLLLLMFALRPGSPVMQKAEELTRISYVEAHHGENVAEKLRLKALARRTPSLAESGRGISTRSAIKPRLEGDPHIEPSQRRSMAEVKTPLPLPTSKPRPQMPETERLQSRNTELTHVASPQLDARRGATAVDAGVLESPNLRSRDAGPEFAGPAADLEGRKETLDIAGGDIDPLPEGNGAARPALDDAAARSLGGGGLSGRKPADTYRAPTASLGEGRRSGSALVEGAGVGSVAPPGGSANGSGRRTILDYGSGSGGGGLRSRAGGLAEGPTSRTVEPDSKKGAAQERIADAAATELRRNGMDMSISGQISGRKILHVVAPVYSRTAKRKGFEGVVAVHFTVLPDGRVKDNLFFEQTSAHRDLNQSALTAIRKFRFAPLPGEDPQVEQWGIITFIFRLK